jgi:predicted AlkP superfamily pyrophosphatase or phosphodiesterase
MISSFPTLTFPNFYTLATGLYPEHHGIVGNSMFDPKFGANFSLKGDGPSEGRWWGGEPIWVTAEKQGVRAACMFWPGSEAEIGGVRPSRWLPYRDDFSIGQRVQTVLDWLELPPRERPRLITLYFHEVDTAGHKFGPLSPEVGAAVAQVDAAIGRLVAGIRELGLEGVVNLVIVSDHGMTKLSPDRVIALSDLVPPDAVQVDFSGAVAGLRPLKGTAQELFATLSAKRRHFCVYLREQMPERLHFRDNRRIPPVILIADEGWMLVRRPFPPGASPMRGGHGFDPALRSMGATFMASGPAFKSGVVIPAFENIEVYDFLCATLGLKPAPNDGSGGLAKRVLK